MKIYYSNFNLKYNILIPESYLPVEWNIFWWTNNTTHNELFLIRWGGVLYGSRCQNTKHNSFSIQIWHNLPLMWLRCWARISSQSQSSDGQIHFYVEATSNSFVTEMKNVIMAARLFSPLDMRPRGHATLTQCCRIATIFYFKINWIIWKNGGKKCQKKITENPRQLSSKMLTRNYVNLSLFH